MFRKQKFNMSQAMVFIVTVGFLNIRKQNKRENIFAIPLKNGPAKIEMENRM